jgi:AmmeMemoRadiSam system protein B
MQRHGLNTRPPKCAGRWYPNEKQSQGFREDHLSSAVISPHAGFIYSGMVSLESAAHVKKNRIWIFGTAHFESPENGIAVYHGNYSSSIGKALFPQNLSEKDFNLIKKYFSDIGHRTEEHSIENVLFCLNHFKEDAEAFCTLVRIYSEDNFEKISDDIATVWRNGDSIIVSTDWNHFVTAGEMKNLLNEASDYLVKGDIPALYGLCMQGRQEACGIDGLYLAYKVLRKVNENSKFTVFTATDSSKSGFGSLESESCVGYISAGN